MQEFIQEILPYVFSALSALFFGLSAFFSARSNKSINKELQVMAKTQQQTESTAKYRAADYRDSVTPDTVPEAQTFNPLLKQYRLNKRTNQLEELDDPLDIQQLIDSKVETALDRTLARLSPQQPLDGAVTDCTEDYQDDLDLIADAMDVAEDYREKLGLADDVPVDQVFQKMSTYAEEQLKKIELQRKAASDPVAQRKLQIDYLQQQIAKLQQEVQNEKTSQPPSDK